MTKKTAILAMAAGLAGCFNTNDVKTGGLVCGDKDACPDGFTCIKDGLAGQPGHCWRKGTGPDAGTSVPQPDAAPAVACTVGDGQFGPFASCTVEAAGTGSTCDPVCQSGCPCKSRCVVNENTYASFECEASPLAASAFVPVQGDCSGNNWASCAPGSICIADDACPWLCYKACRKDADCPANSRCSVNAPLDINRNAVPGVSLCTPPTETCNPTGAADCATPRDGFKCVFLAGQTGVSSEATICDCGTLHYKDLGADCLFLPDDCKPGLVCIDKKCRQLCDGQGLGAACTNGVCTKVYGSTRYGYCRQ
jgi:hypothetical protein